MNKNIEKTSINEKDIYIFKNHHYALLPWAEIRSQHEVAPLLLSFDYHTDTHMPFLFHSHKAYGTKEEERNILIKSMIKNIDYRNSDSILDAIFNLRNDEHILTAIESDIISVAFIISIEGVSEFTRTQEGDANILVSEAFNHLKSKCFVAGIDPIYADYEANDDDDWLEILHKVLLEDDFLSDKLMFFEEMSSLHFDNLMPKYPYILDIDLDYFTTREAINPKSHRIFSKLIKNATAITIAKEPDCVQMCRRNKFDDEFDSGYLQSKLIKLIENALGSDRQ